MLRLGRSKFVGRTTRGDDKPRGRGLGQRNTFIVFLIKKLTVFVFFDTLIERIYGKNKCVYF